jgi:glutamyl-tRNA synthetase
MAKSVRVRIAPSPTGNVHVGNARTALYNYLFARQQRGVFILRIDDTDAKRSTAEAIEGVLAGFRWLGLTWDEGYQAGGPHAPYRQSERLEIYRAYAEKLEAEEKAYRCYCTPAELDALRQQAQKEGRPFRYPRTCLHLSTEQKAAYERAGRPFVLRFLSTSTGTVAFEDLVRGTLAVQANELDDLVIIRSDGFPTYNFASVVDDELMEITHVLRGAEHIPNTFRQLQIIEALGFRRPYYAHLPLLLNPDRTKLGKRFGAQYVGEYAAHGYLAEAVVNFLALLGWNPGDTREIFTMEELVQAFRLDQVNKANAVFDLKKLEWLNGVWMRRLPLDDLAERVLPFLARAGVVDPARVDRTYLRSAVGLEQERLKTLAEAPQLLDFFFTEEITHDPHLLRVKDQPLEAVQAALQQAYDRLAAVPTWEVPTLEAVLRGLATDLGWKAGQLFMPVRVAITGKTATPPLFETMAVLGRDRTLRRLQAAISLLSSEHSLRS